MRAAASLIAFVVGLLALIGQTARGQTAASQEQNSTTTTAKPNYLETGRQITKILDRFMMLGYDKRVRPNYGGPPVNVNVTMRILSISSVSEVMMDFTADFYFRQTWHDPRLSFKKLGDIHTLYVGAEVSKKIWLPDTFFGNEKMAYFHEATTPNVFLRIEHSGEVYRSIRLTVTSSCPMNLQYFPMDRQRCTIEAESYGYNIKDIIYKWASANAVEHDKGISLPQFDIVKTLQKYRLEELSSGTYSRLIAEIHFARRMGYYLIQIYIPSSLIVVISWVSFWLHRNASPARVQLGVTTVLTMTTLMSSTNAALPKISYVKSIDIFLGTCFIMVFAALLEYATVGYLGKRIAMRKAQVQHAQSQAQARLFAQLQAQGAQGEMVDPAGAAAANAPPVGGRQPSLSPMAMEQLSAPKRHHEPPHSAGPVCHHHHNQHHCERHRRPHQQRHHDHDLPAGCPHDHQALHQRSHSYSHHRRHPRTCCQAADQELQQEQLAIESRCCQKCCRLLQADEDEKEEAPTKRQPKQPQVPSAFLNDNHHRRVGHNGGGGASAAAAAAATFINMHRRNKGLPPTSNPNIAHFSWLDTPQTRQLESIFGVRPSDIDKYSRVVFPVCFLCFQLMYWIVYLHISAFLENEQLQQLQQEQLLPVT